VGRPEIGGLPDDRKSKSAIAFPRINEETGMSTREQTTDAVTILLRRYVGEDPARKASLERERILAKIERQIFALRECLKTGR
jgi:hypothetical protein